MHSYECYRGQFKVFIDGVLFKAVLFYSRIDRKNKMADILNVIGKWRLSGEKEITVHVKYYKCNKTAPGYGYPEVK